MKPFPDTEGVIAVLEIGKRFHGEGMEARDALYEASEDFASPKDSARAFWAAFHALSRNDWDFDAAVKAQGKMNQAMKKATKNADKKKATHV